MVEHCFDVARVSGSIPLVPTILRIKLRMAGRFLPNFRILEVIKEMLTKEKKQEIIKQFAKTENDSGSAGVQIALLTERISQIASHLKEFPKDVHSRQGLLKLVGKKRKLSVYLERTDKDRYLTFTKKLSSRPS